MADLNALRASLLRAKRQWAKIDKSAGNFVAPYASAHKDVVSIDNAGIATKLGPRLDEVLRPKQKSNPAPSRLRVVGYDGATLTRKGYIWRRKITKWLKWNCSVDYFLHSPAHGVIKAVSQIASKVPAGAGRIRVFIPKDASKLPLGHRSEIARLKTFHFVVSENPLTLWIETNHQTSEPKAYGCFFFPTTAATETGLGKTYIKEFDELVNEACDEIPLLTGKSPRIKAKKKPTKSNGRHASVKAR